MNTQPFTPSDTEGKSLHQDTFQNKTRETEALVGPSLDHAVNNNTSEMVPPELTEYDTNNDSDQTRSNDSHRDSVGAEHSDNLPVKTHEFSGPRLETFDHGYITASAATSDHEKSHEQSSSASSNLSESTLEGSTASKLVLGTALNKHTPEDMQHMGASGEIPHPTQETKRSGLVHRRNGSTLPVFGKQHQNTNTHRVNSSHDRADTRETTVHSREELNGIDDINRPGLRFLNNRTEENSVPFVSINIPNICTFTCYNSCTNMIIGIAFVVHVYVIMLYMLYKYISHMS